MIKSWTLQNFKSIYEETSLEFSPLTVFAGANSAGKSTLIQSLLLTAQTLQSPVKDRPVVLNGHILKLGSFDDVLSNGAANRTIKIGFELYPHYLLRPDPEMASAGSSRHLFLSHMGSDIVSLKGNYSFSASDEGTNKELSLLQPKLVEFAMQVTARNSEGGEEQKEISIRRRSIPIEDRLQKLRLLREKLTVQDITALEFETIKPPPNTLYRTGRRYYSLVSGGRPSGVLLQHFLPTRLQVVR